MDITIKQENSNNTININVCYDINGNIYVNLKDELYILTIDKNNNPELYKCNEEAFIDLDEVNIKYKKILEFDNTLKKKILDEIEEDKNDDDDQGENYQNLKKKIQYCEEDKYYYVDDDNSSNSEDDDDNICYKFYQKGNKNIITLLHKKSDIISLYDTYIRDNMKNVVFSLQLSGEQNSYRLSIFPNSENLFELNIIGDEIRTYNLTYLFDNEIIFRFNKISYKKKY